MAGPDVLSVSTSICCQEVVKRMEREASFKYQKITLPEEYAANMIYVNGVLIHRSPEEIPASYKVKQTKNYLQNSTIHKYIYKNYRLLRKKLTPQAEI